MYTITTTTSVTTASGTVSQSSSFVLTVTITCFQSTDALTLTSGATISDKVLNTFGATGSETFSAMTLSAAVACTAADIVYSTSVSPAAAFVTIADKTASWTTTSSETGTYTVTLTATVARSGGATVKTQSFQLTVHSCAQSTGNSITAPTLAAQTYYIGDP